MENKVCLRKAGTSMSFLSWTLVYAVFWFENEEKRIKEREMAEPSLPCMGFQHQSWWLEKIYVLSVVPCLRVLLRKGFIGPGLHLRAVHADHAWPPFQWTLNSVFSAYENNNRRVRPPPDRGTLKIVSRLLTCHKFFCINRSVTSGLFIIG